VLRYLEPRYPVARLIETYRSKDRELHSYLEKFRDVTEGGMAVDGVLRASTKPVGAKTGRQSVTDPPLQTLPRGRVVRDAIVARPGQRLILADFAGMEMRGLAACAREQAMLDAYTRGEDLHDFVARSLYGDDFTKEQRHTCKNAGFAKIYGAGLAKFAVTAKISEAEAEAFLTQYDRMFPRVSAYMQEMVNQVMETAGGHRSGVGWVELQDGRRLRVPANKAYVVVNYRIQGGMAVAAKKKVVELDNAGLGACFRLMVHDELAYEVPDEHAAEALNIIETVMPDRDSFPGVTLEIEADQVDRWGQHYRGSDDYPVYVETPDPEWLAEAA
jgi:DNA polymerase-1